MAIPPIPDPDTLPPGSLPSTGPNVPSPTGNFEAISDIADLDTGIGGFVIDDADVTRSTPGVYTFDIGDPDRAGGLPASPINHGGNVRVDHTPKDLSRNVKRTLADYLGTKTKVNTYSIDVEQAQPDLKIAGENNTTPQISPTQNSVSFGKGKDIGGATTRSKSASMQAQSNSALLQGWSVPKTSSTPDQTEETIISEILKKGKSVNSNLGAVDGNLVLSQKNNVEKYQNIVLSNNRFSNIKEAGFEAAGVKKKSFTVGESQKVASETGVDDSKFFNPVLHHPKWGDVTPGHLALVGTSLSLRGSGEIKGSASAGNKPTSQQGEWLAKNAGSVKTPTIEFDFDTTLKDLLEGTSQEEKNEYVSITGGSSWGTLNNSAINFSGISTSGLIALATSLSVQISANLGVFFGILETLFSTTNMLGDAEENLTNGDRGTLGQFIPQNIIYQLLGIGTTYHNYVSCVKEGVAAFFTPGSGSDFFKSALNEIQASGQVAIFARVIIRSFRGLLESLGDIFKNYAANVIADPINAITQIVNIIFSLSNSKLMSALNMFADIGDKVLLHRMQMRNDSADMFHLNHAPGSTKLHWSTNSSPSIYLIPPNVEALSMQNKATLGSPGILTPYHDDNTTRQRYFRRSGRIPHEKYDAQGNLDPNTVYAIERELESEYVPFYFHDIRTNEIVGFHAFLEQLSDDYTANYESVDGMGRVEPVKIYRGTQRRISLSFIIAATSNADFEEMWVKINKLTTLVYPQYTPGRSHSVGASHNFIQPFSQLVGASPLIRIRLGNLLRSNYSKFALARLFGAELSQSNFGVADTAGGFDNTTNGPLDAADLSSIIHIEQLLKTVSIGGSPNLRFHLKSGADLLSIGRLESGGTVENPAVKVAKGPMSLIGFSTSDKTEFTHLGNARKQVKLGRSNTDILIRDAQNNVYIAPVDSVELTPESLSAIFKGFQANSYGNSNGDNNPVATRQIEINADKHAALNNFLSDTNNALVKSFKSAGGKGLAGFIESINFDWSTNVTWDVNSLKTMAPKLCKVSIQFSPIHDISPGIDYNGYNRAPIYQVGSQQEQPYIIGPPPPPPPPLPLPLPKGPPAPPPQAPAPPVASLPSQTERPGRTIPR
jgi:hypothetical protein